MDRRLKHRTDANQPEIVKAFRELGATVEFMHGEGALDLLIGIYGIDQRVEVKDGSKSPSRRKLSESEQATFENWHGRKPVVVKSSDDVIALCKKLRRESDAGTIRNSE